VGHRLPRSLPGALASVMWSRARLRLRGMRFTARTRHDPAVVHELEVLRTTVNCLMRCDVLRAADFCARYALRALDAGHAVEAARALPWEIVMRSMTDAPSEQVDDAIAACEALCRDTGDPLASMWLMYWHAHHRIFRLGQPERALAELDRCLELITAEPLYTTAYDRCWEGSPRSQCLIMLGRLAEMTEIASAHVGTRERAVTTRRSPR
jgi:hypothetical protein